MKSAVVDIELNIDKTKWTPVCLGDVVAESREVVRNPANEGIEKVVGLEHIDSDSMHLRRWETLEQSTTFTKKFVKGQVLFGRRRAYLKKAALAPFDGICSGDITVLEAKNDLMPELLPFLINNDKFFDFAIKNSAGSLSPRAKFKDLANYEFLLPPKDQQARLVEFLLAADEVVESELVVAEKLFTIGQAKTRAIFNLDNVENSIKTKLGFIQKGWKCESLQALIDSGAIISHLDGNHGSFYPRSDEFVNEGIPYISANCIENNDINFANAKYLTKERASKINKGVAMNGDILLAHNATVGPVSILKTDFEKVILSTTLTYYRPDINVLNRDYLFYYMKSRLFQEQIERVMSQSTRNQVPITTQRKFYFIIPPVNIQYEIVRSLIAIEENGKKMDRHILNTKQLQKSLINQIF